MSRISRILTVEDSPTQALKLRQVLEQEGWEVIGAATAVEAMEEINRRPPDLILMDYYLPDVRGDELCRRIRMNIDTRGILILMLTTEQTQQAELRGLESGADDFISKSADPDLLLLRIRALLHKADRRASIFGPTESYFRTARLLTIDDSPTYLEYLNGELAQEGYRIETADSGEDGLRRIAHGAFDCVLVDLVMPGLDGIEVCRRINQLRPAVDNPIAVLMLTGREDKHDLTRALAAGADDFVGKSSDIVVLKGRIRALLRRKFYQEENQRISEELRNKELETLRARAEKEVAEARAALVEELEKTAAELQRSNRDLEQFAYVVSHDLKEPLRMVISYSELLKEEYQDRLGPDADMYIRYATDGARRMRQLIDDLLDYARVGRSGMTLERIELATVAERVLLNLAASIRELDAEVRIEELPALAGNMTLLTQLFQNLIGNALKFRGADKPIVAVSCRRGEEDCEFAVCDNGIGIEPQYFDRIFQIFQRLHTREEYPGTGIGLAVCKKIVELHGGRIWVAARPGGGTEFHFTLSMARDREPCLEEMLLA